MIRQQLDIVLERQSRYLECVQLHSVLDHYEFDQKCVNTLIFREVPYFAGMHAPPRPRGKWLPRGTPTPKIFKKRLPRASLIF